jgi:AcrR family transcriptional regulator
VSTRRGVRPAAETDGSLVEQAVRRSLQSREEAVRAEVQRLLDATLVVIRRTGVETSPKVADIVAEAGLSNQAFYRHFASRDDLLAAVAEAGARRLVSYLEHQMSKVADPADQLGAWVRGVLGQAAKPSVARDTRAVVSSGRRSRRPIAVSPATTALLVEPLRRIGRPDPERDADVIAAAVFGRLEYHLWVRPPADADTEHLVAFCLGAVGG